MSEYCVACDPNPDLGGGMGFEIYHTCPRWRGKGTTRVLDELVKELKDEMARRESEGSTP